MNSEEMAAWPLRGPEVHAPIPGGLKPLGLTCPGEQAPFK